MSETMGPVGAGQYGRFAEMARVDGGHYSNDPHNGFLKTIAELGFPAALALLAWLAMLFSGQRRIREPSGAGRQSFFWGAVLAMALVIFVLTGDLYTMGYAVHEGRLQAAWPILDLILQLVALALFTGTLWVCVHDGGSLRPSGYLFAIFVWLGHVFIDVSLNVPGLICLVALLAALGWERYSYQARWSWAGMPLLCTLMLAGVAWAWRPSLEEDPAALRQMFVSGGWPEDPRESMRLLKRWHELDPSDRIPLRILRLNTTDGQEQRHWLARELATRPADPHLHLEIAAWLVREGAGDDLVRRHLRRVRELDQAALLPRYRLDTAGSTLLEEMTVRLEAD